MFEAISPKTDANPGETPCSEYPALIPVAQATELFDCSPQRVRQMLNRGEIPGCRIGKRLYVKRDELFKEMKEGKFDA